jgi:hypothetical protein
MINRLAGLIISFFVSSACLAQASNYIEVTVNDTILVSAEQFLYRLSFTPDMPLTIDTAAARQPNYYTKRAEEMREKQKLLKEEWQDKIKAAGFTIMPQTLAEAFMKSNYDNNSAIQIFINSIDSLTIFYSLIKNEKLLNGGILSVKTKNEEVYYNSLYKKLLAKSRKRAEYIAASIGKKITGISSISENRSFFSGWNNYPQSYLLQSPPSPGNTKMALTYQVHGNLTVKYSVK